MNDSGAGPDSVDAYIKGMETLTGRIRAAGARPVFLTSSAVNDGTTSDRLGTSRNLTLHKYALALSEFAKREKAPFADQFHSLLDVWGKNKPIEDGFRLYDTVRGLAARPDFPGAENLRQWMDAWNKSDWPTRGASLSGDGVHPGPVGQLTMCVALLQDLRAPGLVSRATFTADGTVREQLQCRVSNVKVENGGLSFDRLDDCLPMPIPREARGALVVLPGIAEMSKWLLDVHGLRPGRYDVSIDGVKVGTATAQELQDGWNMGTLEAGPVADQCRQVLDAVAQKEGLVARWRGLSASAARGTPDKAAMDQVTQDLRTADGRIREAAQPKSHRFVVAPAK